MHASAAARIENLWASLLDSARERGYSIGHSQHYPGHRQFTIQGAVVEWLIYERSVQRKVPLTAKEKKYWLSSPIGEQGVAARSGAEWLAGVARRAVITKAKSESRKGRVLL